MLMTPTHSTWPVRLTLVVTHGQTGPVGLVAFADDPLHPYAVAEQWASTLPRAALHRLALADAATDRSVLGTAALAALAEAQQTPARP